MTDFWKASTKDKCKNGTVIGIFLSSIIIWGSGIYDWIVGIIPLTWQTFAGDFSIPIIILVAGGVLGYIVDKY